jgi:hypothetical protein
MAFTLRSKNYKHTEPTFWVEDCNESERFFMKLGFTEMKSNATKRVWGKDTLNFTGGGAFVVVPFEFQTLKQIIEKFKLKHLVIYEPRND